MGTQSVKIMIADHQSLLRNSIKSYLSQHDYPVVFQASDINGLLEGLTRTPVDILVTELFLPELIVDALREIRDRYPGLRILILSTCADLSLINDLLDIGIYGYLSKAAEPEELLSAITAASQDLIFRNNLYTEALYWKIGSKAKENPGNARVSLSEREKKILLLLWEERSDKEIADKILLSVKSIEKIKHDMREKFGVKSTIGLLKHAFDERKISNIRIENWGYC